MENNNSRFKFDDSDIEHLNIKKISGPKSPPPHPIKINKNNKNRAKLPGVSTESSELKQSVARTTTANFKWNKDTPFIARNTPPAKTDPGEFSFDVYVDGVGVYKVPARNAEEAKARCREFLADGGDETIGNKILPAHLFQADRGNTFESAIKNLVKKSIAETLVELVRKKHGTNIYVLYGPNKGKKKKPQPVGEFPTRLAAKRAELARFPPTDADQLKRARERLNKLLKDPKKRAEIERNDLTITSKPHHKGKPARSRKKAKRESAIKSFTNSLSSSLNERLFADDEIPGSKWDEHISNLDPEVISSDKNFAALNKAIIKASHKSLVLANKSMAKALKNLISISCGDVTHDTETKRMFMPVNMTHDESELGTVKLYVDGGKIKIELGDDIKNVISELEPDVSSKIKNALMDFEEKDLPSIQYAADAWSERDAYLDKMHSNLENTAKSMSGVEKFLLKKLVDK